MGTLRQRFFPIYNHELGKFFWMTSIFLFMTLAYSVGRGLKDSLMLGVLGAASVGGAKGIVVWVMGGTTLLLGFFQTRISKRAYLTGTLSFFAIVLMLFALFVLPRVDTNKAILELPDSVVRFFGIQYPRKVVDTFFFTIFYSIIEIMGTVGITLFVWGGLANEYTSVSQAKRFYSFLSMGANVGTIIAGCILYFEVCKANSTRGVWIIVGSLIAMIICINIFLSLVEKDPVRYGRGDEKITPKKKKDVSMVEAMRIIATSRTLLYIFGLVSCYALGIYFFECIYKEAMTRESYDYASNVLNLQTGTDQFQIAARSLREQWGGLQLIGVGVVGILCTLSFAGAARGRGWRFVGSITPVFLLVSAGLLALVTHFPGTCLSLLQRWTSTLSPTRLQVWVGLASVVCVKAVKYIFFDAFKEYAFLPLTSEEKSNGKAAADALGSRAMKGLGGFFVGGLATGFYGGKVSNFYPLLEVLIVVVVGIWLYVVQFLASENERKVAEMQAEMARKSEEDPAAARLANSGIAAR